MCIILSAGCGSREADRVVVARVGERVIDTKELSRSYMLHPEWKRGETGGGSYLTQLHALLAQKIYAAEAERLGLDRDSLMQGYLDFLKHKEMIRGLYRQEVTDRVRVSDAEQRRMYEWSKKKMDFEYVFTRDSAQCVVSATELAAGGLGGLLIPPDSSVLAGRREGVTVGSVLPEIEEALFASDTQGVRGPIRVRGGFMALRVTGGVQERFLSENEFTLQKQKLEKMIRERRADSLGSAYVYRMMKDTDLRMKGPVFWGVSEYFERRVKEAHVDPMKIQRVNVTTDEIRDLEVDLKSMGDAVVATHRDGALTVSELLRELAMMPGSLRPRARTPQNLKDAIAFIVRNQYLLKEAEREGLDRDSEVMYEYGLQRDETLAAAYYDRRRIEVTVTPEEREAFRKHPPVSEEQVFFKFNMTALARHAKADSILSAELPALIARYGVSVDSARVRSMAPLPDAPLREDPVRVYMREIFM
jgi:hypothetical protein